jgi:hypothetical protein
MLAPLAGATLTLDFPANTTLRGLAIPRVGWADWAVPAEISVTADGVRLGRFTLQAPRHNPDDKKPDPQKPRIVTTDVLDFGQPRSVRQLRVTVEKTDTTGNKHGALKICGYKHAPIRIDLNPVGGVPANSEGVELHLHLDSPKPLAGQSLAASVYQFRRTTTLRAPLPTLAPGENRIRIRWEQFAETGLPRLAPISPQHFNTLHIGATPPGKNAPGLSLATWRFLQTPPGIARAPAIPTPAWEQLPRRDFTPDAEGWRPGIPTDGFGRFGWTQNNGLLVGSLAPDRFTATAIDGKGNRQTANWTFRLGDATLQSWTRTTADQVSVRHDTRYDFSGEMRNELAAKAPELLKETRFPQAITASILAPGFLLDSRDKKLLIEATATRPGETRWTAPRILAPTTTGLRWIKPGEPLAGATLAEGWIIAEWPDREALPLMLALQKKPATIRGHGAALEITFEAELGRLGVAFPSGYHHRHASPATATDDALAHRARQIAAILRAYPHTTTQHFRTPADDPASIEIRETTRHLEWTNDWAEPARRVAPLPPLVRFAADQGYPVKLSAETTAPEFLPHFAWPTKTGNYTAVEGDTLHYRLPVPPRDTRLYLRPAGSDTLADHIAAALPGARPDPGKLATDGLNAWWMTAPSSLALTLLDPGQREKFLEAWRIRIDQTLRPNAWFLRREPFSQAAYPVSFGWIETSTGTLGDLNSGLGAVLYAAWAYARCSGDWPLIAQNWPALRGALEYYLVQHDWNNMQTGAREHSGSSAIDMDGIGYEGAIAYAAMSEQLGYADDAALGRLLAARLGLSTVIRWLGPAWTRPGLPREQWTSVGVGLSEFAGFDTFGARHGGPDHAAGEIALSLSWVGQYPELYDLHLRGAGRDFWQWFEHDFVEKKMENWRKDHPGNRNNHPANIAAHLYMRGLLGAPLAELRDELSRQAKWGLEPHGDIARENAALYAMLVGRDFPVSLTSWGRAAVLEAVYDDAQKRATLRFRSDRPGELTLALAPHAAPPASVLLNGKPVRPEITTATATASATTSTTAATTLRLPLPEGESRYEISFP